MKLWTGATNCTFILSPTEVQIITDTIDFPRECMKGLKNILSGYTFLIFMFVEPNINHYWEQKPYLGLRQNEWIRWKIKDENENAIIWSKYMASQNKVALNAKLKEWMHNERMHIE